MTATLVTSARMVIAASPEALDAEFLDYLASCENASDNWTVVADDEKPAGPDERQKKPAAPSRDTRVEAKEKRP